MKVLASITIVVSLPTMVASFYGMNVTLPLQQHPEAFPIILALAFAGSALVVTVLWRKDWL
jgi:magnesium transporter